MLMPTQDSKCLHLIVNGRIPSKKNMANKDIVSGTKHCYQCNKVKQFSEFRKNRSRKDGLSDECSICNSARRKNYYTKNREIELQKRKEYYSQHSKRIKNRVSLQYKRNISSWIPLITKSTSCQICGAKISLNTGDINKSIHFDHRKSGTEVIKLNPTDWLNKHKATEAHKKIWKSCNFGMLCNTCNNHLPTKDRIEWLEKALKYAKTK